MKLKFKRQPYQTDAVEAVADCLAGQPAGNGLKYRIDPGRYTDKGGQARVDLELEGFRNPDILVASAQFLDNVRAVQRRQGIAESASLTTSKAAPVNLDIEMETGTGKTYCYIKTMFELNKRYGWSEVHRRGAQHRHPRGRATNRSRSPPTTSWRSTASGRGSSSTTPSELHNLESFSSDAGINVMIINVQAFNATRQGRPPHLRGTGRLPVPQAHRRHQPATGRS